MFNELMCKMISMLLSTSLFVNSVWWYASYKPYTSKTYSELGQKFKKKFFAKIFNDFQPLNIFAKLSI